MTRARLGLTVALFGAIAAGLFLGLPGDKLWRSSEERCVGVVQAMLETGDWLVPHLDGVPRLQKPPLFYWLGALAAELTGLPVLTALRSVSALAALALAGAVFAFGHSLGGFPTAWASTLALGATAFYYMRGRVGDAEMLLALLVFLALVTFERLWRTRDRRLLPVLSVLVGLGFLVKATAALLCILAPIACWLALERRISLAWKPAVIGWGLVALAIGISWYAAILWLVPNAGELFRQYLVGPMGMHASGRDATHLRELWYYWPRFPVQTAPAGLGVLWLAWEGWKTRFWREDPRMRFLAVAFLALISAWSLVPSKQIHYLLPMVPLQAAMLGRVAVQRLWKERA